MDSIFGVGIAELAVILVMVGLIFGPKQIQLIAGTMGKFVGKIRGMSGELRNAVKTLNLELDALEDVKAAKSDLVSLQTQLAALQNDLDQAKRELLHDNRLPDRAPRLQPRASAPRDAGPEPTIAPPKAATDSAESATAPEPAPPTPVAATELPNPLPVPDDEA